MTILTAELQFFQPSSISDVSTNGGRLSSTLITSGVLQNVWPHVLKAERDTGSTKYRKIFQKVSNDLDEILLASQYWLDNATAADDWVVMFSGTQRDTQGDLTGSERLYGCANLQSDAAAAGNTIVVEVEDASIVGIFVDGDTIRITDKDTPDSLVNNEEFHVINGVPVVVGTQVTITTTAVLTNTYTVAGGSRVSSIFEPGDIAGSFDNWVVTSTAGTYDEAAYPVITDNIGTVEETWTLTFSDANSYSVVGDSVGAIGSGNITTDFIPDNADWTKPYFTLEFGGFGGTWAAGETIVFQTHPAATPLWEKRVVPALASSLAGNSITLVVAGESA